MICPICGKECMSIHGHHKLSDSKLWNRLYGKRNKFDGIDWINHPDNKQQAGSCCNTSHNGQGKGLECWTEIEFCEHFNLIPRSKTFKIRKMR